MKILSQGNLITVKFFRDQDGKRIFERVVWLVSQNDNMAMVIYSEAKRFRVGALMHIGEENGLGSKCEIFDGAITLSSKNENAETQSPLNYYTFKTTPLETETFSPISFQ